MLHDGLTVVQESGCRHEGAGLRKTCTAALTFRGLTHRGAASNFPSRKNHLDPIMKIRNSLKSLKDRHRDNRVIRRRGRTYVINKTQRRFKARQG